MKKIKGLFGGKDKSKKQDKAKNEPENAQKTDKSNSKLISTTNKEDFTTKNVEEIKIQQFAKDQDDGFKNRMPAQSEMLFRSQREIVKVQDDVNDLFATLPSATQNRARMTTNFMDSYFETQEEDEEEDDHNEDMFLNKSQRDRYGNQMNLDQNYNYQLRKSNQQSLDLLSRSVADYDYFGKEDLRGDQFKQKEVDQTLGNSQSFVEPISQQIKDEKVIAKTQLEQVINDSPQKIDQVEKIIEKPDLKVTKQIITEDSNKDEPSPQIKIIQHDSDLSNIQQETLVSNNLQTPQVIQIPKNIEKQVVEQRPDIISQSKQTLVLPVVIPQQQVLKPVIPPVNIPTFKPVVFPPVQPVIIPQKQIISNQTGNLSETNLSNNNLNQILNKYKSESEIQTVQKPISSKDDLYSIQKNISIETNNDVEKVGPPELLLNPSDDLLKQQESNLNYQNQKIISPQKQISSISELEVKIEDPQISQKIIVESQKISEIQVPIIPQQIQNYEPQLEKVNSNITQALKPQVQQINQNESTIEVLPTNQLPILEKITSLLNNVENSNLENDIFQPLPKLSNQYRMSSAITERGENDLLLYQNNVGEEKDLQKANSRLSVRPGKNSVLERIKEKRQGQVKPNIENNDFNQFTEKDESQQNSQQQQTATVQQQQLQIKTVQLDQTLATITQKPNIQATNVQQHQIETKTVQQQQIQSTTIQQKVVQATTVQQEQIQRKPDQQQNQTTIVQIGQNDSQKYNFNPNGSVIRPPIKKQPVQDILLEEIQENYMDFSIKRNEIRIKENQPIQTIQTQNEILPQKINQEEIKIEEIKIEEIIFSSDSELTDQDFEDNISIDSDEVDLQLQRAASQKMALELIEQDIKDKQVRSIEFVTDFDNEVKLANSDIEAKLDEEEDFMKLVSNNEIMFRSYAEKKLRDQRKNSQSISKSLNQLKENSSTQSVVSEPILMKQICKNFGAPNIKATCIALNPELILVGTSAGILFGYNKDTEQPFGVNKQDSKDFIDNAITCIDVHSRRPDYCVIGYARGQLALINLKEMKKTIKLIKDHHKRPIVSIKFCDWIKEKPHQKLGPDHSCKECQNVQSWMFISCDTDGKVVQNIVENVGLGLMIANNSIFVDPNISYTEHIYQVLATRMSNQFKPVSLSMDSTTLVALGCSENVLILVALEKQKIDRLILDKPKRYLSQNSNTLMPIMSQLPILSWGFGKSPKNNFKNHPILAIAWGPLIQLVVFKKEIGNNDFDIDGYYIIAASQEKNKESFDIWIESLHWLDDSLLVAVTSNNEIRVMITEKFHESQFNDPNQQDVIQIQRMDIRKKMMPFGHVYSEQQLEIELERKCVLSYEFVQSYYGLTASQTHTVFEDRILSLTNNGIYQMHHLNWLENLGNLENQLEQGQWIEIFSKALEIYLGNIKGLRLIKGIGQMYQDNMKDQLKGMIDKQVMRIINSWKTRADQNQKIGFLQMQDVLNFKFQTLIRIVIEFCVEIQEPTFLFDTLLKKFQIQGKSKLFADELKPYILSGHFSECEISENILKEQILQYFINDYQDSYDLIKNAKTGENVSPAISPVENIEKILLNFKFSKCSKDYQFYLIEFCKKHSLTSALIHLCLTCFGEQGPLEALTQLKDFAY